MKKILLILFLLLLPACALAQTPFEIDELNLYKGMTRNYMQGYVPTVANNALNVVLPLTSGLIEGKITAVFEPDDLNHGPFKLQSFEKQVSRQVYTFGGENISVYRVRFALALHSDRVNGEYPFAIIVRGKDAEGNDYEQRFDMEAVINDGKSSSAPSLLIDEVQITGRSLLAGEDDTLCFRLTNQSLYRAAEGVAITFCDASGDILSQGSNVIRVGRIPTGGECLVEIPLTVKPKAVTGAHIITLVADYTDSAGQDAELTEQITIGVRQPVRFTHSEPMLPTRVSHGDIPSFSMTLMNMGKSTLYNALLTFDLPGLSSGSSVLVGTIEGGESKNATANFKVAAAALGDVEGRVVITYEDESGEIYEEEIALRTTIIEKVVPTAATASGEAGKETIDPITWVGWGVAALLLLVLIVQSMRLTKKIHLLEERNL